MYCFSARFPSRLRRQAHFRAAGMLRENLRTSSHSHASTSSRRPSPLHLHTSVSTAIQCPASNIALKFKHIGVKGRSHASIARLMSGTRFSGRTPCPPGNKPSRSKMLSARLPWSLSFPIWSTIQTRLCDVVELGDLQMGWMALNGRKLAYFAVFACFLGGIYAVDHTAIDD